MNKQDVLAPSAEIANLLSNSPFARVLRNGEPLLVIGGPSARLVYCNAAALALFSVDDAVEFSSSVLNGASQGGQRLRQLAASPPGGAPRFELLRFFAGRMPLQIGLICAGLTNASGELFLAAATEPLVQSESETSQVTAPSRSVPTAQLEGIETTPRRFVWSSDADGRFSAPSQTIIDVAGAKAPRLGETLSDWRSRVEQFDAECLAKALASGATFQALRFRWPAADGQRNLVSLLSGAPTFDRDKRFLGFRGFGVFTGETEPASAPARETGPAIDSALPPTASPAPARAFATSERSAEIVALRPTVTSLSGAPNVVPIRPSSMRVLTTESPVRQNGGDGVALTTDERDAFREIARALGARMRARDDRADPPIGLPADAPGVDKSAPEPERAERDFIDLRGAPADLRVPAAPDSPRHALAGDDARRLLDCAPIGLLVTRGEEALYLNRTLLELIGYADIESFRQASGVADLFRGREPEEGALSGAGGGPLLIAAANDELIPVEGLLQTIEWGGASATLISLRRPPERSHNADDTAARSLMDSLEAVSDGVLTLDADGKVVSIGRRAEALLGVAGSEIIGENFAKLLAAESREAAGECFESVQGANADFAVASGLEVWTRPGRKPAAKLHIAMISGQGGAGDRCHVVLRDQSAAESALRRADEAKRSAEEASAHKSAMLAAISHEIRTPLNAVLGFTEVMRDERFGPIGSDRYKQYVNDIHLSGKHVLSLVNDLLDLSKIEAGKLDLDFRELDANRIIQDCVALMQANAASERVIVRQSLFDKLPAVIADERSLRQILLNLISNAVKFNEPGGQVIVSSALSENHQAVIRVRDTGIGMNESELAAALEPFRQAPGRRRSGGTGLGLPLTKALAEANHAGFSINSRKEQGTLIELTFPIAHAQAAQ